MSMLIFAVGVVAGIVLMWLLREKNKTTAGKESTITPRLEITLNDIIRLASLNSISDLNGLMIECRIPAKAPVFYEKYQLLSRQEKDFYFSELVAVCARNREEEVEDFYERYPGLSTQDILLWLMMEIHIDNKTMARVLGIQSEALKKRKTRLRFKMRLDSPVREGEKSA